MPNDITGAVTSSSSDYIVDSSIAKISSNSEQQFQADNETLVVEIHKLDLKYDLIKFNSIIKLLWGSLILSFICSIFYIYKYKNVKVK